MAFTPLNALNEFLAVARRRSFAAAAADLEISPSALSQAVRQLEEKLGVTLLSRTTRSVALTAAGRRLFEQAGPAVGRARDPQRPACARVHPRPFADHRLDVPVGVRARQEDLAHPGAGQPDHERSPPDGGHGRGRSWPRVPARAGGCGPTQARELASRPRTVRRARAGPVSLLPEPRPGLAGVSRVRRDRARETRSAGGRARAQCCATRAGGQGAPASAPWLQARANSSCRAGT